MYAIEAYVFAILVPELLLLLLVVRALMSSNKFKSPLG